MKMVLFLAGRVGWEALRVIASRCSRLWVILESEHPHEYRSYRDEVIRLCEEKGIPFALDPGTKETLSICREARPDYLFCFGYRKMVGREIRDTAQKAALGSHFAPLPRYRGFAPLNWALINGETETAVNLFYLVDEVDAGKIIARKAVPIAITDDINSLTDKCVAALSQLLPKTLERLEVACPRGEEQDHSKASYTCSRSPEDGLIDWRMGSMQIYNLVRALTYPMPGAYSYYAGQKLLIWACEPVQEKSYVGRIPGKVIAADRGEGFRVLTGDGSLLVTRYSLGEFPPEVKTPRVRSVRETLGRRP